MRLHFFGDAPPFEKPLIIYILTFFKPEKRAQFKLVNKQWKDMVDKTNHNLSLMPTIQRIPFLAKFGLDKIKIHPLKAGMTNHVYRLKIGQVKWVLRMAGKGSSAFINREDESNNAKQAEKLGLNVTILFSDPSDGLQLTQFIENRSLNDELLKDPNLLSAIAFVLKRLHQSNKFSNTIEVFPRNTQLLEILKLSSTLKLPEDVDRIEQQMPEIAALFEKYKLPLSPCHNDTTPTNFLLSGKINKRKKNQGDSQAEEFRPYNDKEETLVPLDYEYSGNNDAFWDLAYFALYGKLSEEQIKIFFKAYYGECIEQMLAWYEVYKPVIAWWVAIWSWTEIINHADAAAPKSYEELAMEYYMLTKEFLNSPNFKEALKIIEEETITPSFSASRSF